MTEPNTKRKIDEQELFEDSILEGLEPNTKRKYFIWEINQTTGVPKLYEEGIVDEDIKTVSDVVLDFGELVEMNDDSNWALRFEK